MNYLGHNEFGIDHKSWKNPINFDNFNDINYWLEQWYLFYQDIIKKYQSYENCFFIFYEDLTNLDYLNSLLRILDLNKNEKIKLNFSKTQIKIEWKTNIRIIYTKKQLKYIQILKIR